MACHALVAALFEECGRTFHAPAARLGMRPLRTAPTHEAFLLFAPIVNLATGALSWLSQGTTMALISWQPYNGQNGRRTRQRTMLPVGFEPTTYGS